MVGTANKLITYLIEQTKDKQFELKEFKEKRSNDANAYFHVLVNKLARHLNISDEDMKIKMNLDYGTIARFEDGRIKGCKEEGDYDCYIFYKETHTLNTTEMSQLINGVIQECKDNGIEVRPQAEIDAMLERWDKK